MNDEQTIFLPAEVVNDWNKRLRDAGCSGQDRAELTNLIRFTLPYPSRSSVDCCVRGYAAACYDKPAIGPDADTVSSVLKKLEQAGHLETSNRYGQSHPVATGLKKLISAASALRVAPDPWLSFYIAQCHQALTHNETMTPSSYYRHTVYLRDVALFVMHWQVTGSRPADETVAQACRELHSLFITAAQTGEPMPMPVASVKNLDDKIDLVCGLLANLLSFGVPTFKRSPKNATDSSKSKISGRKPAKLPQYLTPQPQSLKHPRPRPMVPRRQSLAYALGEGAEDIPQQLIRPVTTPVQGNPEARVDSEVMAHARVDAPPEFAPSERRKQYVSLLNVQAAQNTLSRSDMQRFSRRQLSTWLERFADEHPLTAVFLLLIWSLGMASERLQKLRLGTQAPTGDEDVLLNPHTHWLSYRVLNLGATSDESATGDSAPPVPATHLMQLALPASLVESIVEANRGQPFLEMEKRYPALRKQVEKTTGTRPCSLKQWAASTPAFDAGVFSQLESAVKRGTIAFNEIASSAYRAQDLATLNAKFAERLVALRESWDAEGLMMGPGTQAFRNLAVTADVPEGLIGSQRYAPPEALVPVVEAIRNAIKQAHQRLNAPFKTHPLSELLALINLQALNYFLVLQLHSVGRPLNHKTRIGISTQGLWVSDKASHRYRERKIICAMAPEDVEKGRGLLLQQRHQCRQTQHKLAEMAHKLGITVQQAEPGVTDFPCFTSYSPAKRCIEVGRMTPAKHQRCVADLGLSQVWRAPANVVRHMASTELSQTLSDAVVDEVLGHKHPGKDWWGTESSGSMAELEVMASVIETWAERMGLRVAKLDPRVFGGFYRAS